MSTQPATPAEAVVQNVRRLREGQRLTQEDLAERLTYLGHSASRRTVMRMENGQRGISVDELAAVALALGTSPAVLMDPLPVQAPALVIGPGAEGQEPATMPAPDASAWLRAIRTFRITWTTAEAAADPDTWPLPVGNEAMTYEMKEDAR